MVSSRIHIVAQPANQYIVAFHIGNRDITISYDILRTYQAAAVKGRRQQAC